MLSCGYFHVMYYIKALVKKAGPPILGFNHERPNSNDGTMEEFRSAISHTKDSKTVFSAPTFNLNTVDVLALFKKMVDEVCFYSHLHFINFYMILLFLLQECVVLRILKWNLLRFLCIIFLIIIKFHNFLLSQDCELLYLSDRPEKLIMENIAVPPVPIRPSVIMSGSQRSERMDWSVLISSQFSVLNFLTRLSFVTVLLMLLFVNYAMGFFFACCSNENDITERLKRIIQANASLRQELLEASTASNRLVG